MKGLSIHAPFVYDILTRNKREEYRSWTPAANIGRIVICSSARAYKGYVCGYALCTAQIGKIADLSNESDVDGKLYAWTLKSLQYIEPVAVKGKLHLFDVSDEIIKPLPGITMEHFIETYYDPLRKW